MSELLCMRFPHSWNFLKTRDTHRISRFKVFVPNMLLCKESVRHTSLLFLKNVYFYKMSVVHIVQGAEQACPTPRSCCLDLALVVSSLGSPAETSKDCGLPSPNSSRCLPREMLPEVCLRKSSALEGIRQKMWGIYFFPPIQAEKTAWALKKTLGLSSKLP